MKTIQISILVVAMTLVCSVAALAHDSKVGFINPHRIVAESKLGKLAQEDLARMGREKDRQVTKARNKALAIRDKLGNASLTSLEAAAVEDELQAATRAYEKTVTDSREELKAEERRLVKYIMSRADTVLGKIADDEGFTMILTNPESIAFVLKSADLTDRVVKALDAMK